MIAETKQNKEPNKHWKVAIVIGKLNILNNFEIKTIWNAQKKAPIITKESPRRTDKFSNSLKNNPPLKHISTAGQIDQCIDFENRK